MLSTVVIVVVVAVAMERERFKGSGFRSFGAFGSRRSCLWCLGRRWLVAGTHFCGHRSGSVVEWGAVSKCRLLVKTIVVGIKSNF